MNTTETKNTRSFSMHPAITGADTTTVPLNLDFARPFVEQVTAYFQTVGDLHGYVSFGLPGQAVAAVLALPVLEMAVGFPTVEVYDIGAKKVVGEIALGEYRHNMVRPRRAELAHGEAYPGYVVIDGAGRGLTPAQLDELKKLVGSDDVKVVAAPLGQLNFINPTKGVVDTLLATGITWETFTSGRALYLPAGMGLGAVVQATAIYGLGEVWPKTIRLNKVGNDFVVAEIVDPQDLRQFGVQLGAEWTAGNAPVAVSRELLKKAIGLLRREAPHAAADGSVSDQEELTGVADELEALTRG